LRLLSRGIRDATEMAAAIVPEAREFNDSLTIIAAEVTKAIDGLLCDLDRRIEALRPIHAALEPPQSLNGSPEVLQISDDLPRLPQWLPRKKSTKKESVEDQCCTTAA